MPGVILSDGVSRLIMAKSVMNKTAQRDTEQELRTNDMGTLNRGRRATPRPPGLSPSEGVAFSLRSPRERSRQIPFECIH